MPKQRVRIGTMKQQLPCLLFTLEQVVFLQKALAALEQITQLQTKPLPNLEFARATVTQVQAKIQHMTQLGIWGEEVELDFNEVLILQTSVWLFAAALEVIEPSLEKEQQKKQCQTLSFLFATSLKQAHGYQ